MLFFLFYNIFIVNFYIFNVLPFFHQFIFNFIQNFNNSSNICKKFFLFFHRSQQVDQGFLEQAKSHDYKDGSVLAVAVLCGGRLYAANAGDCRVLLVNRRAGASQKTVDHTLKNWNEQKRIHRGNGQIAFSGGEWSEFISIFKNYFVFSFFSFGFYF